MISIYELILPTLLQLEIEAPNYIGKIDSRSK
jgi:hypothetical protein